MKRSDVNFLIDSIAFTGFVFLTTTGILMRYILPPGSGHHRTIWDLDRHDWGHIHFWIAVVFLSVLSVHLVLHWSWVLSIVIGRQREGSGFRAGLGLVGLAGLIAIAGAPLLSPVEITKSVPHDQTATQQAERTDNGKEKYFYNGSDIADIRGYMTLKEVEERTGVPAEVIIRQLHLPSDTPKDERLGELKNVHGFTMDEVRQIIRKK